MILKDKGVMSMLLQLLLVSFVFLVFVDNGSAGVTSTFIRSEWPSVDIPLDDKAFAIPKGHNAPQQVSYNTSCLHSLFVNIIVYSTHNLQKEIVIFIG